MTRSGGSENLPPPNEMHFKRFNGGVAEKVDAAVSENSQVRNLMTGRTRTAWATE